MTREQEIREREAKATLGPWEVAPCSDRDEVRDVVSQYEKVSGGAKANWIAQLDAALDFDSDVDAEIERLQADAEFIAHARTDIPYLLAENQRLREDVDGWVRIAANNGLDAAVRIEALERRLAEYQQIAQEYDALLVKRENP